MDQFLTSLATGSDGYWILDVLRVVVGRNFNAKDAKDKLNKNALLLLQTTREIYSTRDRRDGQAVGRHVLRRKGSVISSWLRAPW